MRINALLLSLVLTLLSAPLMAKQNDYDRNFDQKRHHQEVHDFHRSKSFKSAHVNCQLEKHRSKQRLGGSHHTSNHHYPDSHHRVNQQVNRRAAYVLGGVMIGVLLHDVYDH